MSAPGRGAMVVAPNDKGWMRLPAVDELLKVDGLPTGGITDYLASLEELAIHHHATAERELVRHIRTLARRARTDQAAADEMSALMVRRESRFRRASVEVVRLALVALRDGHIDRDKCIRISCAAARHTPEYEYALVGTATKIAAAVPVRL